MECDKVRGVWEEYTSTRLPTDQRRSVSEHLAGCVACRRYYDDLAEVQRTLLQSPYAPVPSGLWEDIERRISPEHEGESVRPLFWGVPHYAFAAVAVMVMLIVSISGVRLKNTLDRSEVNAYLGEIQAYLGSDISWVEQDI